MVENKTHYTELGLERTLSTNKIKQLYPAVRARVRNRAERDTDDSEALTRLSNAYTVLANPVLRPNYDNCLLIRENRIAEEHKRIEEIDAAIEHREKIETSIQKQFDLFERMLENFQSEEKKKRNMVESVIKEQKRQFVRIKSSIENEKRKRLEGYNLEISMEMDPLSRSDNELNDTADFAIETNTEKKLRGKIVLKYIRRLFSLDPEERAKIDEFLEARWLWPVKESLQEFSRSKVWQEGLGISEFDRVELGRAAQISEVENARNLNYDNYVQSFIVELETWKISIAEVHRQALFGLQFFENNCESQEGKGLWRKAAQLRIQSFEEIEKRQQLIAELQVQRYQCFLSRLDNKWQHLVKRQEAVRRQNFLDEIARRNESSRQNLQRVQEEITRRHREVLRDRRLRLLILIRFVLAMLISFIKPTLKESVFAACYWKFSPTEERNQSDFEEQQSTYEREELELRQEFIALENHRIGTFVNAEALFDSRAKKNYNVFLQPFLDSRKMRHSLLAQSVERYEYKIAQLREFRRSSEEGRRKRNHALEVQFKEDYKKEAEERFQREKVERLARSDLCGVCDLSCADWLNRYPKKVR